MCQGYRTLYQSATAEQVQKPNKLLKFATKMECKMHSDRRSRFAYGVMLGSMSEYDLSVSPQAMHKIHTICSVRKFGLNSLHRWKANT